jgi:hypothetical protein
MGRNVYQLILPKDLSCLHPVFHISLLLPFVDLKLFPGTFGSKAPLGPHTVADWFWDKKNVEAILGYWSPTKHIHQSLICWRGGSTADDSWVWGCDLAPCLQPFMTQFDDTFGGAKLICSPDLII